MRKQWSLSLLSASIDSYWVLLEGEESSGLIRHKSIMAFGNGATIKKNAKRVVMPSWNNCGEGSSHCTHIDQFSELPCLESHSGFRSHETHSPRDELYYFHGCKNRIHLHRIAPEWLPEFDLNIQSVCDAEAALPQNKRTHTPGVIERYKELQAKPLAE
jgi:hypothetical protein